METEQETKTDGGREGKNTTNTGLSGYKTAAFS